MMMDVSRPPEYARTTLLIFFAIIDPFVVYNVDAYFYTTNKGVNQ